TLARLIAPDAAAAEAQAPTAPPSPAPFAPEPSAFDDDAAMRKHADPVASYTLEAKLDTTKHLGKGRGAIEWTNASSAARTERFLHLYLNAFKNERTVCQRVPAHGFRGSNPITDFGWIKVKRLFVREMKAEVGAGADKHSPGDPDDETDIRVPLPRAVEPDET